VKPTSKARQCLWGKYRVHSRIDPPRDRKRPARKGAGGIVASPRSDLTSHSQDFPNTMRRLFNVGTGHIQMRDRAEPMLAHGIQ